MLKFYIRAVAFILPLLGTLQSPAQGYDSLMWVPNGPVNALVKSNNDIYLGGDFSYVGKPTGFAVPIDSGSGQPIFTNFPKVDGPVYAIAPDQAGGWYIGGKFNYVGGQPRKNFARIKQDGTVMPIAIDPDGPVYAIATAPSYGSPYVFLGGEFQNCGGIPVFNVCQVNSMTQSLYTTWTPKVQGGAVRALTILGNNVWIGGSFTSIDGLAGTAYLAIVSMSRNYVPQIQPAGTVVFNPNSPTGTVYALYYNKPSNRLFAGGAFTFVGPNFRSHIVQIHPGTLAVTSWNPNVTGNVLAISGIQPPGLSGTQEEPNNGKMMSAQSTPTNTIYIGGNISFVNGIPANGFAELDVAAPTLIQSTTDSAACNGVVWSIFADKPNNRIYVGGTFTSLGGASCYDLACLDTFGLARPWPVSVGNKVNAILSTGRRVYIGSDSPCMYGIPTGPLISYNLTTDSVNSWMPAVNGSIHAMALSSANVLYLGGTFTSVQSSVRSNLAAIDLNTQLTTPFNPGCNGTVRTLFLSGQKLYIGGYFTNTGGQSRSNAACIDIPTSQATTWSPVANGTVNSLIAANNSVYCGGYFSVIGGAPQNKLARLDTVGGYAINSWSPDVNDGVYALASANGNLLSGGWFTAVDGTGRSNFCSLGLGNGSLSSYNPAPDGTVRSIGVSGNYGFVGGDFMNYGGASRKRFAAFDVNNSTLQPLHTSFSDAPMAYVLDGNELYVGGLFTGVETDVHAYFVKVHTWYLLGENEPGITAGEFSIYPNPSTGSFTIKGPLSGAVHISIFNSLGQKVLEQKEEGAGFMQAQIDLTGMAPGMYYIRLVDGETIVSAKVLLTRP